MNKKLLVSYGLLAGLVLMMLANKLVDQDARTFVFAIIFGFMLWLIEKAFGLFTSKQVDSVEFGPPTTLEAQIDFLYSLGEWQEQEFKDRYFDEETGKWLWEGQEEKRRVVCSAVRYGKLIIPSVRHTSVDRWTIAKGLGLKALKAYAGSAGEQGFLDQWSRYMDRKEAYKVAVKAGQIDPTKTPQPHKLFSEDVWP